MLTSFTFFQKALEGYNKNKKENYTTLDSGLGGLTAGFTSGLLVIAIIFIAMELLVMFYAIGMAIKCTGPGRERIIHIVLAIAFTFPYMLLMILFNKCGNSTIV